jgi:glycosyltransferase involved in cell wall biosynthesis
MLAQDHKAIEIVVSDNASTDGTQHFCETLARVEPRLRYYRQPRNIGPIRNYGEVLRLATGDLYMHLADDDELELSYVSNCVAALDADPDLTLACGRAVMYREGVFERESTRTNLLDNAPATRLLRYYETVHDNGAFHGVVRRSVLSRLPPMRDGVIGGDWLFMASVAYTGRIRTLEETTVTKHLGGTSATMESIARTLGLTPLHARYWIENIMLAVFRDIAWESPVYAKLGHGGRLSLAAAAVAAVARRFRGRWANFSFARMAITDALLPVEVKRTLISIRDGRR